MNRRTFLILVGATAAVAIDPTQTSADDAGSDADILNAGPISDFRAERVYDTFRDRGVLIVRRGEELLALSPICTHRGCKVRPQADQGFVCKCHGSQFDKDGKVLTGPAARDLLRLKVKRSPEGHVLIRVRKPQLDAS